VRVENVAIFLCSDSASGRWIISGTALPKGRGYRGLADRPGFVGPILAMAAPSSSGRRVADLLPTRACGEGGKRFFIYKLRTMKESAESETGPVWATESDPRRTNIGAFLRRRNLDELPQFWNVLIGI